VDSLPTCGYLSTMDQAQGRESQPDKDRRPNPTQS